MRWRTWKRYTMSTWQEGEQNNENVTARSHCIERCPPIERKGSVLVDADLSKKDNERLRQGREVRRGDIEALF